LVFTANAANTGGTISYNATGAVGTITGWQQSIDGGTTWTTLFLNGPGTYTFNNLSVQTKYRASVTNGSCSTEYTNVITGNVPGVGLSNAVNLSTIGNFGVGVQTTVSSNLASGVDSPQSIGTGLERWFKFTATNNLIRIAVTATGNTSNNDITLYNAPTDITSLAPLDVVESENNVYSSHIGSSTDLGNEILYSGSLVVGQVYYVSVRNVNNAPGTVSVTFSYLRASAPDIAIYTNNTYNYTSACQNFKAAFRSGASSYTINRWATPTDMANAILPVQTYTIPGTTTVCQLGRIVPANLGTQSIPYYISVDVAYNNLLDAYGEAVSLTAKGLVSPTASFTMLPETTPLTLRTTDQCAAGFKLATYGSLATNRSVCGTNQYQWEFTEANAIGPVLEDGPLGGSRTLLMTAIDGILGGQTYQVRIQSMHISGGVSGYGAPTCMKTLGTAGMPTVEDGGVIAERSENGVTTSIYPNPNNGQSVNFAVSGMEGELNVRIADATGRMVYANRYMVEGSLNTTIDFGQTLAGGVYMVEMIQNGEMKTMRMVVSK
jgi:hypothetical protein